MKILMLGEYSSLFNNLKLGLEKCGHVVSLYADGDGWKNLSRDANLTKHYGNFFQKINSLLVVPLYDKRFYVDYDLVMLINAEVFHPFILHRCLKKLKKHNKKVILCSCGHDEALFKAYSSNKFDYYVFDDLIYNLYRFNGKGKGWTWYRKHHGEINDIEKYVDVVIPSCYEYKVGYTGTNCNVSECIPFPIDVDSIEYHENIIKDKIVIFHGLNREIEKGTPLIKKALNIIQERYRDKVEIVIDGKMPYDEYVKLLRRTNIVIDQCKSYAYGMNACIAMAQGKVVLSGARDETLNEFNISREECPVVPISPDINVIVEQLAKLIEDPKSITSLGAKSRKYIEKYHDANLIAQRYIDACNNIKR